MHSNISKNISNIDFFYTTEILINTHLILKEKGVIKIIHGIKFKKLKLFPDDRGFFTEVLKEGDELFKDIKQTSYTETYPGVIKAFHWHKKQTDIWFVAKGMAQVVLYDIRKNSPTYKETNVIYMGEKNYELLLIPPGVVHGYKVLGNEKVCLFYHTDCPYNPKEPDEERLPYNTRKINFDWSTKFK